MNWLIKVGVPLLSTPKYTGSLPQSAGSDVPLPMATPHFVGLAGPVTLYRELECEYRVRYRQIRRPGELEPELAIAAATAHPGGSHAPLSKMRPDFSAT